MPNKQVYSVQFLFKGKNIVLTFINCVVLQPTIIFTSFGRAILWEYVGLGILFLDPDFHYFWIMVVLVHCAVQWNCWAQLLPDCGQPCATVMHRAFLGVIPKAVWKCQRTDRVVMQELCLVQTCAEWSSWKEAALSSPCPCWFPTEHRVAVEGVPAQRPRRGSHGRRRSVPLGQPRAAPLCAQHPRALTCCCKCLTVTLLYSCPKCHLTKCCNPDRHKTLHSP